MMNWYYHRLVQYLTKWIEIIRTDIRKHSQKNIFDLIYEFSILNLEVHLMVSQNVQSLHECLNQRSPWHVTGNFTKWCGFAGNTFLNNITLIINFFNGTWYRHTDSVNMISSFGQMVENNFMRYFGSKLKNKLSMWTVNKLNVEDKFFDCWIKIDYKLLFRQSAIRLFYSIYWLF